MTIHKRFLLICHDRSGSNLLKGMLGQHPDIYVIPALPIFEIIYYFQEIYGDLSEDENWDTLLHDVTLLYEANHHPLPHTMTLAELRERPRGSAVVWEVPSRPYLTSLARRSDDLSWA